MATQAVINIITLCTSGDYHWWDEFPLAIYEKLKERGIDYIACYRGFSDASMIPVDIRFVLTHKESQNPFVVWKKLKDIIRKYDQVIVHNHSGHGNWGLFVFNNKFCKKTHWITTDHDSWFHNEFSPAKRRARIILRKMGFLPEVIIGCSKASMERLKKIYGEEGIDFVYNGVDFDGEYIDRPIDSRMRGVFCGRLEAYKGIITLLESVEMLKRKGIRFHLDVLGNGGAYEQAKKFIEDRGIGDMVTMHGHVFDVKRFLKESGIGFIVSEWNENFPVSSLEYQALGLVSIYTNSGGLPEGHIDGKTGICVPKKSPQEIANAVEFLINNPGKWKEMSKNAYENAKRFSMDRMAERYVEIYERLFELR